MIEMITKLKVSVQNHGLIVPDGGIHRGKEKRTAGGGFGVKIILKQAN